MKPTILWFTGLSGSGKTTTAKKVKEVLDSYNIKTVIIDGDDMRRDLSRMLTFSEGDRVENVRRAGAIARMIAVQDIIVLVAMVSPYKMQRDFIRYRCLVDGVAFKEIYVTRPLKDLVSTDEKGLHKSNADKILLHEPPDSPDVTINTSEMSPSECADKIFELRFV